MKTYLVTYDLNKEGAAYTKAKELVISAIKSAGQSIHCLTTTWIVRSNFASADQLSTHILNLKCIDSNDRLLVTQLCSDKQGWLAKEQWNFINDSPSCRACN